MKAGSSMLILAPLGVEPLEIVARIRGQIGVGGVAGVALLRRLAPRDIDIIVLGGYRVIIYADEKFLRGCRDANCAWPGVMLVYET